MKCIKNGSKIKRVDDKTAQLWVNTNGWTYTSKEEWKKSTRKEAVVVGTSDTTETGITAEEAKATKVHGLKAKDRKKANKKKK